MTARPARLVLLAGSGTEHGITVGGRVTTGVGEFPAFRWGLAPTGLATRRQLAALGLRPGGQEPVARLLWARGTRVAYLFRIDLAAPKRPMTPARWAAVRAALAARRTCPTCHQVAPYVIPTSLGTCLPCADRAEASDLAEGTAA